MSLILNPTTGRFDVVVKDHTKLKNIGTNTHAQIDTALDTTIPATYLPLAGGTMVGDVIFNDNISLFLAQVQTASFSTMARIPTSKTILVE